MTRPFLTSLLLFGLSGPALAQPPEKAASTPAATVYPAVKFGVMSFLQYAAELHERDGYNAFDVTAATSTSKRDSRSAFASVLRQTCARRPTSTSIGTWRCASSTPRSTCR